nr:hypothetical protein [Tanacetum cinerariifolium]
NYLDSVRGELKEEFKEEVKVDLTKEMKFDLKEEMKADLKEEMKNELKEEMREELKKKCVKSSKKKCVSKFKTCLLIMVSRVVLPARQKQSKEEMKADLKEEMKNELKEEMHEELKKKCVKSSMKKCVSKFKTCLLIMVSRVVLPSRQKQSKAAYNGTLVDKYGSDPANHPIYDDDLWKKCVRDDMKGGLFGFTDPKVVHRITSILKTMFNGSWTTWKEVHKSGRDELWAHFKEGFSDVLVQEAWENSMKKHYSDIMSKARNESVKLAKAASVQFEGADCTILKPYNREWIKSKHWVDMIERVWKTEKWLNKAISGIPRSKTLTIIFKSSISLKLLGSRSRNTSGGGLRVVSSLRKL